MRISKSEDPALYHIFLPFPRIEKGTCTEIAKKNELSIQKVAGMLSRLKNFANPYLELRRLGYSDSQIPMYFRRPDGELFPRTRVRTQEQHPDKIQQPMTRKSSSEVEVAVQERPTQKGSNFVQSVDTWPNQYSYVYECPEPPGPFDELVDQMTENFILDVQESVNESWKRIEEDKNRWRYEPTSPPPAPQITFWDLLLWNNFLKNQNQPQVPAVTLDDAREITKGITTYLSKEQETARANEEKAIGIIMAITETQKPPDTYYIERLTDAYTNQLQREKSRDPVKEIHMIADTRDKYLAIQEKNKLKYKFTTLEEMEELYRFVNSVLDKYSS